ncbi:MAG TPA: hypothetical protein VK338_05085, partial [Candidatus Nitrosocosmicus sp.]|nr:hypothetical protein [Candidatus Nitrosocosmicus sp.]
GHGHGGHGHGVSEMDVYRRILNRALAGVAATRFGSKFAKFERDRFNSDGKRTWQEIRESIGWAHAEMQLGSVALYDAAMKDISIAETMLRKEKTEEMRRIVDNGGTLDEANMLYMMTREKIIEYLNAQGKKDEEIQRALDVFEKIQKRCTQNEKFLTDFTKNIIEDRKFSFSWGTEELELSFLSFSNVGDKMLGRTVGDIATIEREITGRIYAYFDALHATATSGEEKYDKLLEQLTPMKRALRDMHGPDYANKVIHHLAVMTIGYFKRDENAQGLHEISNIKQVNSLAAKYAGESTSVWEWRKPEIDAFIHELSAKQILNEVGYEMNKDSKDIHIQERTFETLENTIFKDVNLHDPESVKKHPILSKLKKALSWKSRGHDYDYSAHMLREEFHVTKGEMLTQSVLKAIGIMFLLALILTLKKAFEDFKSDGGGGGGGGGHGNGGGHH